MTGCGDLSPDGKDPLAPASPQTGDTQQVKTMLMTLTPEQIEAHLGFLIRRSNQISVAIFLEETVEHDLTPPQYAALAFIMVSPGIDQTSLVARTALDRSTMTGVIDRLEDRGLIERRVDPQNRRARQLYLTPRGVDLFQAIHPKVTRVQERILAPLDESERTQFLHLISKLVDGNNAASRVPIRLHNEG